LLLKKHCSRKQCQKLVPCYQPSQNFVKSAGLIWFRLGETLASWTQEIVAIWRFTRNNGITEGFHAKMEVL
jgi:hypothetical protein